MVMPTHVDIDPRIDPRRSNLSPVAEEPTQSVLKAVAASVALYKCWLWNSDIFLCKNVNTASGITKCVC